jgi:hypothetical protein
VQRLPVDGGKGRVAGGKRGIANVVVHFAGLIDGVAQFFQRAADQQGLEGLFRNGALNRFNGNAFARQVGCPGALVASRVANVVAIIVLCRIVIPYQ